MEGTYHGEHDDGKAAAHLVHECLAVAVRAHRELHGCRGLEALGAEELAACSDAETFWPLSATRRKLRFVRKTATSNSRATQLFELACNRLESCRFQKATLFLSGLRSRLRVVVNTSEAERAGRGPSGP